MVRRSAWLLLSALAWVMPAQARVTKLEVVRTEPAFGGQSFGDVGVFEHVVARVEGELDPADPHDAIIQDIELAPRDARGMVHYATDVELLKPQDQGRGNGVLLFEVNNRGNKLAVGTFNDAVAPGIEERNGLSSRAMAG